MKQRPLEKKKVKNTSNVCIVPVQFERRSPFQWNVCTGQKHMQKLGRSPRAELLMSKKEVSPMKIFQLGKNTSSDKEHKSKNDLLIPLGFVEQGRDNISQKSTHL